MSDDAQDKGFLRGLQSYGDRDFSIYMRRAFARSFGTMLCSLVIAAPFRIQHTSRGSAGHRKFAGDFHRIRRARAEQRA